VNLSGKQFTQPSLAKEISGILLDLDFDASGLVLELTESAVMKNPEAAQTLLMQLRVLGARVALDDFGTGYSSLSHLRQFPLDFLKIDYSFIKSIETSADTMEIVRTITTLARQLGLRVIAEGIENSRQLDLLRSLQCEYGQGFLFSKAVDGGKAKSLLLNGLTPGEEESASTPSPEIPVSEDELQNPPAVPESETQRKPSSNRKYILWALSAVILPILGSLMARLNRLPSINASHNSPPALVSGTEKIAKPAALPATAEKVPAPEMQKAVQAATSRESATPVMSAEPGKKDVSVLKTEKISTAASPSRSSKTAAMPKPAPKEAHVPQDQKEQPVAVAPKLPDPETMPNHVQKGAQISSTRNESPAAAVAAPAVLPKTEREAATITVYTLPVVHDHVLGSCRGMLTFDRDGISFVSEKAKDSFYFKYPDFSYRLDGDRLTIKAGSAVFRFKSAAALDKDENRSQLSNFYQGISKLHEEPSSKKAALGR